MDDNLIYLVSIVVIVGGILALIGGILSRTEDCTDYQKSLNHVNKCKAAFYLFYIGIFMVLIPILGPIFLLWLQANSRNLPLAVLIPSTY